MDARTKRIISEIRNKPILVGNYCRNAKVLTEVPIGTPCRRLTYSYEPLRRLLETRNISWRKLALMVGLTTNSVVDLSKDRPVSLDIIASICYYLSLTPNEVVEFIYSESTINKADYAKAGKRLDTAAKMVKARLEKQGIKPVNPEKREELYSGGLHTPLHALNASAVIREQERQKQACRKVASLFPEDKKPAAMSLTEGESNDKKNAKENESSDILFED